MRCLHDCTVGKGEKQITAPAPDPTLAELLAAVPNGDPSLSSLKAMVQRDWDNMRARDLPADELAVAEKELAHAMKPFLATYLTDRVVL